MRAWRQSAKTHMKDVTDLELAEAIKSLLDSTKQPVKLSAIADAIECTVQKLGVRLIMMSGGPVVAYVTFRYPPLPCGAVTDICLRH